MRRVGTAPLNYFGNHSLHPVWLVQWPVCTQCSRRMGTSQIIRIQIPWFMLSFYLGKLHSCHIQIIIKANREGKIIIFGSQKKYPKKVQDWMNSEKHGRAMLSFCEYWWWKSQQTKNTKLTVFLEKLLSCYGTDVAATVLLGYYRCWWAGWSIVLRDIWSIYLTASGSLRFGVGWSCWHFEPRRFVHALVKYRYRLNQEWSSTGFGKAAPQWMSVLPPEPIILAVGLNIASYI